jgi:hypothetical protein
MRNELGSDLMVEARRGIDRALANADANRAGRVDFSAMSAFDRLQAGLEMQKLRPAPEVAGPQATDEPVDLSKLSGMDLLHVGLQRQGVPG